MDDKLEPGRWLYGLAAAIFFVGGISSYFLWTSGVQANLRHNNAQVEALVRVPVDPEGRVVDLAGGLQTAFIEYAEDSEPSELVVVVTNETGERVGQFVPSSERTYSKDGRIGEAISEFEVEDPGDHRVTVAYLGEAADTPPVVAIGGWGENRPAILLIGVGMAGLGLCLVGGVILALVALQRRRGARRVVD